MALKNFHDAWGKFLICNATGHDWQIEYHPVSTLWKATIFFSMYVSHVDFDSISSESSVFHEFPCDWERAKIHGFIDVATTCNIPNVLWDIHHITSWIIMVGYSDASVLMHPIRAHMCQHRVNHRPPRCERSDDHDGVVAPPIRTRNRPKEHALAGKL